MAENKRNIHELHKTVASGRVTPPPKDPPKAKKFGSEEEIKKLSQKIDARNAKPLPPETDEKAATAWGFKNPTAGIEHVKSLKKLLDSEIESESLQQESKPKDANNHLSSRKDLNVLPAIKREIYNDQPLKDKPYVDDGRKKKGILDDEELTAIHQFCEAMKVPQEGRDEFVRNFLIDRARLSRPKWATRLSRNDDLSLLSAPNFLRRVHSDYISEDGTVYNETIRAIDPDLMAAIEQYMSTRRRRLQDPGDAKWLNFVLERPLSSASAQPRRHPKPT